LKNGKHWKTKTSTPKQDDMWLIRKHKTKAEENENKLSDKVAGKIANAGITIQQKFAAGMNKFFRDINTKRLKLLLILFCVTGGGYSIYLVGNAVMGPKKNQNKMQVEHIKIPKHFDQTDKDIRLQENYIDETTYNRIVQFKNYMDSLQKKKSYLYDSIIQSRPYLMDSALMLEEIYLSQQQK
jgi:hypothetical protein